MSEDIGLIVNDRGLIERLTEVASRISDLSPAMLAIGEVLTESTKDRFATSTGPDGKAWKRNAVATVLERIGQIKGAYRNDGRLSKKGAAAFASKKPLVDTGVLADSIAYQVNDSGNGVVVGTNRFAGEWDAGAAVHQFGSKDGTIPARPFLGISPSDEKEVLDILSRFVGNA